MMPHVCDVCTGATFIETHYVGGCLACNTCRVAISLARVDAPAEPRTPSCARASAPGDAPSNVPPTVDASSVSCAPATGLFTQRYRS